MQILQPHGNDTHRNINTVTVFNIYLEGLHKSPKQYPDGVALS